MERQNLNECCVSEFLKLNAQDNYYLDDLSNYSYPTETHYSSNIFKAQGGNQKNDI